MNLLPQAVLAALTLCNQHVDWYTSGSTWIDPKYPDQVQSPLKPGYSGGPSTWKPGYEKCQQIEEKAVAIVTKYEEEQYEKVREARNRQLRMDAQKDKPVLEAALDALK